MTKAKLSETEGTNPLWDFVNAAEKVDAGWANGMRL